MDALRFNKIAAALLSGVLLIMASTTSENGQKATCKYTGLVPYSF